MSRCYASFRSQLLSVGVFRAPSAPRARPSAIELGQVWDAEHLPPPLVRHADVVAALQRLRQATPDLVRMNFVGLLTAPDALATGDVDRADPATNRCR